MEKTPRRYIGKFDAHNVAIGVDFQHGDGVPKNIDKEEHSHDFTELIVIHGGHGVHRVDQRDYGISAGNVFVVKGYQTHSYRQRHDLYYATVKFQPRMLSLPEDQLKKLPGYNALFLVEPSRRNRSRCQDFMKLAPEQLEKLMTLIRQLDHEVEGEFPGYESMAQSLLVQIMVYLSREYVNSDEESAQAMLRVGKVIGLLEQEYAKEWQLEALCRIADMSKSNLLVVFREVTGMTPIEYLIDIRLRQAMHLLERNDATITEIAYKVGFTDSNYFARQFRKEIGASPSEYRKIHARAAV
ncbi:MAG: helix-turn-helix domain-containing protein [Candidatus Sumerlaeia bacterium]